MGARKKCAHGRLEARPPARWARWQQHPFYSLQLLRSQTPHTLPHASDPTPARPPARPAHLHRRRRLLRLPRRRRLQVGGRERAPLPLGRRRRLLQLLLLGHLQAGGASHFTSTAHTHSRCMQLVWA